RRHLHGARVARRIAGAVHSVRLRRIRTPGRPAADGHILLGGDAARRGAPLPASDRLALARAPRDTAMSAWDVVVGIETHAQLLTKSKMFSGASTAFGASPNTQASAVDIALPGTLPVPNSAAIELAIRFGLVVGGVDVINRSSVFARKNYFYPDLPKGYQISQYELPIVRGGEISIDSPTRGKVKVRLTRAHLEEDAGKSLHEDFRGMTGIDLNRAGTPLLEIVSEPELRSAQEAAAYAKSLHRILTEYQICDGDMEKGSFRCDANVSVRKLGVSKLGTRCEIK